MKEGASGKDTRPAGLTDLLTRLRLAGKGGWLLLLGLLGLLLLAWGNLFTAPADSQPSRRPSAGETPAASPEEAGDADQYALRLAEALTQTLSQVQGAGQVSVRVFPGSGPRYEYARKTTGDTRTTQETDRSGTSRVTSEQHEEGEVTVMRGEPGGKDQPVVVVTHLPEVQGVLVVASGAGDPVVRAELTRAVQTALNLPPHRVRVLAREGER